MDKSLNVYSVAGMINPLKISLLNKSQLQLILLRLKFKLHLKKLM
jgi:hypothetical protein